MIFFKSNESMKKYQEYDLKQNDHVKYFFLLNFANVPLLLSTISNVDTLIRNCNKAGRNLATSSILNIFNKINTELNGYLSPNFRICTTDNSTIARSYFQ